MPDAVPDRFRAYVVERHGDELEAGTRDLDATALPDGDVTVRVAWSSVNFKDALASTPDGKVARISPLVPGIDLAGEIVSGEAVGEDGRVAGAGSPVLVHGYDLGVAHHGGYAEYARVPADWVVPLPDGLGARTAMALGTAGYTAALAVHHLEQHGLRPGDGPVLVTGASGGLGAIALNLLAGLGHEVVASTGSADAADLLRELGAAEVIDRGAVGGDPDATAPKPLERQRWAGAVDVVGGRTLSTVLATLRRGAAVAACGNTGGMRVETTVAPFILRGVALLGVDSAWTPLPLRRDLWARLAGPWRPSGLDRITAEVGFDGLADVLEAVLAGRTTGRVVVRVGA